MRSVNKGADGGTAVRRARSTLTERCSMAPLSCSELLLPRWSNTLVYTSVTSSMSPAPSVLLLVLLLVAVVKSGLAPGTGTGTGTPATGFKSGSRAEHMKREVSLGAMAAVRLTSMAINDTSTVSPLCVPCTSRGRACARRRFEKY